MKKVLIGSIVILFTGCLGGTGNNGDKKISGFHIYETSEFSIQVPDGWETLTENGILAGFRSNVRNPKYTSNAVMIKNRLSQNMTSEEYAKALKEKTKNEIIGYNEIQSEGLFLHFSGRHRADSDMKRFLQISAVKGKNAYVVIGSFVPEEEKIVLKKMEDAVKSFMVK